MTSQAHRWQGRIGRACLWGYGLFFAVLFAVLLAIPLPAMALDLSMPTETAPVPATEAEIFVLNGAPAQLSAEEKFYVRSLQSQVNARMNQRRLLDEQGEPLCAGMTLDYLAVFDRQGRFHSLKVKHPAEAVSRGSLVLIERALFQTLQQIAPLPPVPVTVFHGPRLIGIASQLRAECTRKPSTRIRPPIRPLVLRLNGGTFHDGITRRQPC